MKPLMNVIFGSRHVRAVKRIQPIVDAINAEYERLQGDTGTAPSAEALRKAVFFRLWQAELGLSPTQ